LLRSGGSRPAPTVTPLLLTFVSHHQQVARNPTGVNVSEPIYRFKDQEAATDFDLQWSEQSREGSGSDREWNPHPLKRTFEPHYSG
jgi:hypothetical protein